MDDIGAKKVTLNGMNLVLIPGGALAPAEHFGDDGNLTIEAGLFEESYAHVFEDGLIRRYHQVIGSKDDLVEGWPA